MQIKLDHVTVCSPGIDSLRQELANAGLAADYGGPHANGVTHMALVGFDDGSYLELIAPLTPGVAEGSPWSKLISGCAGACAWAIGVADIRAEMARLHGLGIETKGPTAGSRKRPDGKRIEWETASAGPGEMGSLLPFMIQDHTLQEWRVQPSASVRQSGLSGISAVVLQVEDLDAAVALFRSAYEWEAPLVETHCEFGARVACFSGTPVILAAPTDKDSWLAKRLEKFGACPVAYFLETRDLPAAAARFQLSNHTKWFARDVAWFDMTKIRGLRLGVVQI